jgi:peptidoglycan/LPS O-acetylase OafA/YrhL
VIGAALLIPANHSLSIGRWVQQAALLETYRLDHLIPGLTQIWSLAVEVGFYLFLPLFGILVAHLGGRDRRARLRRQLLCLVALSLMSWAYRLTEFRAGGSNLLSIAWLPAYLDWFALGMAGAAVTSYLAETPSDAWGWLGWVRDAAFLPGTCWLVAGSLYWLSATPLAGPLDLSAATVAQASVKHVLYGLVAVFALLPGFFSHGPTGAFRTVLGSAPLRWLGTVSYGIFLWNVIFVSVSARVLGVPLFSGAFFAMFAVTYLLSVATAAASWYGLERPALRLRTLVT